MATLTAVPTSDAAPITDETLARDILGSYDLTEFDGERTPHDELVWEIRNGELSIWGYAPFDVYRLETVPMSDHDGGAIHYTVEDHTGDEIGVRTDHESGPATRAFVWDLTDCIATGAQLDIQSAGYTKCHYPVYAVRYLVRPDEVLRSALDADHQLIDPPEQDR